MDDKNLNFEMRLTVLENSNRECIDSRKRTDVVVDQLMERDQQLTAAVQAVGGNLEILIGKLEIGFKAVCYGCAVIVFIVSTLIAYQNSNDAKYQPREYQQDVRNK
jgi:hypothetical protein